MGAAKRDGCICMRRDDRVYCNTDIERAKLVRVKATFPFARWNMHEKMHRDICERCTGSAELRDPGGNTLCRRQLGPTLAVMTRERNCFRLCILPANRSRSQSVARDDRVFDGSQNRFFSLGFRDSGKFHSPLPLSATLWNRGSRRPRVTRVDGDSGEGSITS